MPSWKLTYPLPLWHFWVDDFPNFPFGGIWIPSLPESFPHPTKGATCTSMFQRISGTCEWWTISSKGVILDPCKPLLLVSFLESKLLKRCSMRICAETLYYMVCSIYCTTLMLEAPLFHWTIEQTKVLHQGSIAHEYSSPRFFLILPHELQPRKLTWNPEMEVWKIIFLFNWVILSGSMFIFRGVIMV